MRKFYKFLLGAICVAALSSTAAQAQTTSFKQTNLVSDTAGVAAHTDPNLINPWGVAFLPGQPFWIANNNNGNSTVYDRNGVLTGVFGVPSPRGSSNPSTPTGLVANVINGVTAGFTVNRVPSQFIFDTEDGTISGWNGIGTDAILAIDNSAGGAVYKGLALVENDSGDFVLATNFNSGSVEAYGALFQNVALFGSPFVDPTILPGFAPFGIHVIANNQVVVTFAQQDALKHDPVHAAGAGFVSLFDANGAFIRRIASQGTLNAPWGAAIAPATFGAFPGALLIGNFGDGTINAFNLTTGAFLGQLKDTNGAVITNLSLWELLFDPSGRTGDPNTLYISAGLANEKHGLFAAITPNTNPASTPDFNLSAQPGTMTITAGQTATFSVTVGSLNGFNSAVALACSGLPVNSTCNFSPVTATPASGGMATSMVSISTSSSPYHAGVISGIDPRGLYAGLLLILLLALVAIFLAGSVRNRHLAPKKWVPRFAGIAVFVFATVCLLAASGCGYSANNTGNGTQRGMATVMITGTSGSLSHSTSVSLTVQ